MGKDSDNLKNQTGTPTIVSIFRVLAFWDFPNYFPIIGISGFFGFSYLLSGRSAVGFKWVKSVRFRHSWGGVDMVSKYDIVSRDCELKRATCRDDGMAAISAASCRNRGPPIAN